MINRLVCIFFLALICGRSLSQEYERVYPPVYTTEGFALQIPWAGGINFAHYNEVDLNLDGIMDLVVWDKTGSTGGLTTNHILPFINSGITGKIKYKYAPEYIKNFPHIVDWLIMRDYNCDGKMDIFTGRGAANTFKILKNVSDSVLKFETAIPLVKAIDSSYSLPAFSSLYASVVELIGINDVDGDGDIDIMGFNSTFGFSLTYYKNLSMELYSHCDSAHYEVRNKCWGNFTDLDSTTYDTLIVGLDTTITTRKLQNAMLDTCFLPNLSYAERKGSLNHNGSLHSGSTILLFDIDRNNVMDLLLANPNYSSVMMLRNGGSVPNTNSTMIEKDVAFPSYSEPVDLSYLPASFWMDVDNDSLKDLLFSPNQFVGAQNIESSWLYLDKGDAAMAEFDFIRKDFLQGEMLDFGEGAFPVFHDFDSDGRMDILVSNQNYNDGKTTPYSTIKVLKNISNDSVIKFQLFDTLFTNLFTNGEIAVSPTFGDLDNDGDKDMIVGLSNGKVDYYKNSSTVSHLMKFESRQASYQGIDVWEHAAPQLVDLDEDGLLDLVVGSKNRGLVYFKNSGTATSPVFTETRDTLGNIYIDTNLTDGYPGYLRLYRPHFYKEDGTFKLLLGNDYGHLYQFDSIEGNISGSWRMLDHSLLNEGVGYRTSPTAMDLNGDGKVEIVIGNYSGGLHIYSQSTDKFNIIEDSSSTNNIVNVINYVKKSDALLEFELYPNPNDGNFSIITNGHGDKQLLIFNLLGEIVYDNRFTANSFVINQEHLPQGIYVVRLLNNGKVSTRRILVK